MVRLLLLQTEEALYVIETMRRLVPLELGEDAIPDESTILRFRHLLERHDLTAQLFALFALSNLYRLRYPLCPALAGTP